LKKNIHFQINIINSQNSCKWQEQIAFPDDRVIAPNSKSFFNINSGNSNFALTLSGASIG
jgi:hypothetical protein